MNVYEALQERLKFIFSEFDNVYVSFSGGKDSGILLNLCKDFLKQNYPGRKLSVFHMDYEAQYQMTTDYVDKEFEANKDILEIYRVCLPMAAQCSTSMTTNFWLPWEKEKQDIWVRELPKNCINEENNCLDFFKKGMWDYELQEKFGYWLHKKNRASKTVCLVGIRTDESFNRWRAIHSDKNTNKYKGKEWTLDLGGNVYNAYPIFDWKTEDVWVCNARFKYSYNKLYDLFYQAGLKINQMRVASPFNNYAMESLKLYKVIDPKNWGRMIGRVNGVNFAGLYGGTTAMGWKSIKLPAGHTWKTYMEFLLKTLPEETANSYKKKLKVSRKFWNNVGGCISKGIVRKLKRLKIEFKYGKKSNRKTNKLPIIMDYLDDIDIKEFQSIPTYKRMCVCIIKNDHACKYMGFGLTKTEWTLRHSAEKKYKEIIK